MAKGMTIGVLGDQTTDPRNAKALLADFVGEKPATLIFPVTEDHFSDPIQALAELAGDEEWPYEVIVDESTKKMKAFRAFVDGAQKQHQAEDPIAVMIGLLLKKPAPHLILVWDGEKESELSEAALEAAGEADVPAFSLVKGLEPLGFEDEDEEDEGDEEDEDSEPEDVDEESEDSEDDEDADSEEEEDEDSETDEDEDSDEGADAEEGDEDSEEDETEEDEEEAEDEDTNSEEDEEDEDSEEDEDEIEDDDAESEEDEDEDVDEDEIDDEDEDSESDSDEEIEDDDDDEEEDEESEEDEVPTRSKKTPKKFTRTYLEGLETDDLYAIAKPYKILPGRGRGRTTIITELLAKTGSEDEGAAPVARKTTTAKKTTTPAKKTTAAKKTTGTRSTAADKPATRKTSTGTRTASTKTTARKTTSGTKTATAKPAAKTRTTTTERPARTTAVAGNDLLGRREVRAVARAFRTASDNFAKAADALEAVLEG